MKIVQTTDESEAINLIKESSIIIAGSGMVTHGHIKHHIVKNITRPENILLSIGYQVEGAPGMQLLSGPVWVFELTTDTFGPLSCSLTVQS